MKIFIFSRQFLEKIELQVEEGRNSKLTKKNKTLAEAVGQISKFNYELSSIEDELKKTVTDDNILKEYHDLVTASKKQFREEVEAVTPGLRYDPQNFEKLKISPLH